MKTFEGRKGTIPYPAMTLKIYIRSSILRDRPPPQGYLRAYLEPLEQIIIEETLNVTRYNITEAAELLGISRTTLRSRMKRHHIPNLRS